MPAVLALHDGFPGFLETPAVKEAGGPRDLKREAKRYRKTRGGRGQFDDASFDRAVDSCCTLLKAYGPGPFAQACAEAEAKADEAARPPFDQAVFDLETTRDLHRGEKLVQLAARLLGPAAGGQIEVLDIGCGKGTTTAALARALPGAHITAIDRSGTIVEEARGRMRRDPNLADRVDCKVCRMEGIGDELGSGTRFDAVFSNAALNYTSELHRVLAASGALLRHGGVLALQMESHGAFADLNKFFQTALGNLDLGRDFEGADGEAAWPVQHEPRHIVKRVLQECGFCDIEMEREPEELLDPGELVARFKREQAPYYLEKLYGRDDYETLEGRIMDEFENVCRIAGIRRVSPIALYVTARKA